MLQETNVPAIQQGVFIIRELSEDEQMREMSRRREIALRDERSALGNARRLGRAEGFAEGQEKERAKIIRNLKKYGMNEEQIALILSQQE